MKKDLPIHQSGLISALRNGDEKSFRMIFDHFYPGLYNFSYQFLKNKEKSQEVVQETFVKLWLNRENLNEQYSLAPYLYTITRRLTLNSLRQATTSQAAMKSLWKHVQKEELGSLGFTAPKYMYFPILQQELNTNPNLKQNLGY